MGFAIDIIYVKRRLSPDGDMSRLVEPVLLIIVYFKQRQVTLPRAISLFATGFLNNIRFRLDLFPSSFLLFFLPSVLLFFLQ